MVCKPHPILSTIPNKESISTGKTCCNSVVLASSIIVAKCLHRSITG